MAATGNVTLRLSMSGDKSVSARLDQLQGKTNRLAKAVEIRIGVDDKLAETKISNIFHELETLNRSQATIKMKFPDYASAVAKLDELKAKTDSLDGRVIKEKIKIDGAGQALLEFTALGKAADHVDKKTRSLNLPGLFQGVSGVGAGASAVAIEALTSPVGAASALAATPFLGTALGGGILGAAGAGLAGVGIAGALGIQNKNTTGQLSQAQNALTAAQQRQSAAQLKLNKLQSSGKATAQQLAAAQAVLTSASASVAGAQDRLNKVKAGGIKQDNDATEALANLGVQFRETMSAMGAPLVKPLADIFGTLASTLKSLTPTFAAAEKTIAGPFKEMGTILATSLGSPQVVKSIQNVAKAFADFLVVFSPQIPGIVNSLANGITGIATAFTDHPGMIQGMANVVDFLLKLPGYAFSAIGALVRVTSWLTSGLPHEVSRGLDAAREFFISFGHNVESTWNATWNAVKNFVTGALGTVGSTISGFWSKVTGPFTSGFNSMLGVFKGIAASFSGWWKANGDALKQIWATTWGEIKSIIDTYWPPIENVLKVGLGILVGLFKISMGAISVIWNSVWALVVGTVKILWAEAQAIIKVGWAVISLLFKTAIGDLVAAWRVFWAIISNVAKVVWTVVENTIKGIWDIIVGIFTVFINLLTGRWGAALNAMKNMGIQIWNLTKSNLSAIWNAIKNIGIATFNAFRAWLGGLWNNVKGTAIASWNAVKNSLVNIWHAAVTSGKSIWNSFFGWLKSGWHAVVSAASTIWNGIKTAVRTPVAWVVNNVWDPFASIIDTATNFLHLGRPLPIKHMAAGGLLPGYGGGDRIPALLEAGETVVDKQRSRKYAGVFAAMGVPGYASGGVAGGGPPINLHTGVSNSVGAGPGIKDIVNVGKTIVGFGKKLVQGAILGVVKPAVNGILGLLSHAPGANTAFGKMVTGLPRTIANDFFNFIAGKDKAFNATAAKVPNVGSGVQRWAGLVVKALQMEGLSTGLAKQVLYQMQTESGGNPNAINLTDINAQHGDPSRGLLQTIMSTFRAYHWPGTSNNIYDPLANIAAAINYARHVYGPTLMRGGMGMGSGHGYALGTNSAARGWAWVGERGPELMWFNGGEKVIPGGRVRGGDGSAAPIYLNIEFKGQPLVTKAEIGRTVKEAIAYAERHGNK